jgi:ubiquinone/menaquinone biosynthesis C-methylase UbiE
MVMKADGIPFSAAHGIERQNMFKQSDIDLYEYAFDRVNLSASAVVLDVGCQHAGGLKWIKEKYHLMNECIGIDKRSINFEDAETQQALGVFLLEMNASEPLAFADNAFDLIFHKDTLECISDIAAHISEMHRILKPGGIIVCIHRDWESIVFNGNNKVLINKAIYSYANFLQAGWMDDCDGWIGRRVWGYFNKTGLFDGAVKVYNNIETDFTEEHSGWHYMHEMNYFLEPKGFLTKAEYAELIEDMKATYACGEYLCMSPYYIYTGRKKWRRS